MQIFIEFEQLSRSVVFNLGPWTIFRRGDVHT